MIVVLGTEGSREYEAALELRDMIVRTWPCVEHDEAHDVRIIAGAKCHGQDTRDIDLLLLARLGPGIVYCPFLPFQGWDGRVHTPKTVRVRSLCCVIELKDHDPNGVRFIGTTAEVEYHGRWHNASEQNEKQLYAVKNYLESHAIQPPWITPLLWLRNVPNSDLPPRPHPILGSTTTWELMLNVMAQMRRPRREEGEWILDASAKDSMALARMVELFTKEIVPTHLDRARVERITARSGDLTGLLGVVGHELLILRGHGGTGKTMRLLQLAHYLSEVRGDRVLILTYNRALVADIRRLLAIVGIRDDLTGGAIHIQTVHSFLYAVLRGLGVLADDGVNFLDAYELLKDEALELIRGKAVTAGDIDALVQSHSDAFEWDYVFIDEGQDWPRNERDLLLCLYPSSHIAVGDGVAQMVRTQVPAEWVNVLPRNRRHVEPLTRSLRMKSALARFATSLARHLNLLYHEWEANLEIPGGRIIIVDGPYLHSRALHDELMRSNEDNGNEPVDALCCVPPTLVARKPDVTGSRSVAATVFGEWGYATWDGASQDVRESYPESADQLRIVQYESCRGLEGWTSINLSLDRFYESKLLADPTEPDPSSAQDTRTPDKQGLQNAAAQWIMIPVTRAIDTLVVQLDRERSILRSALEAATRENKDTVRWITTR